MNTESQLSLKHLRVLYFEYKDTAMFSFAVSTLILLINFIIFNSVVRPQYDIWQENNKKVADVKAKIEILKENNRILSTKDPAKLSSDFQLAIAALPDEQDYAGIIVAIASAATNSGIFLEDYNFRLGDLKSKKQDLLPVILSIGVRGSSESVESFMKEVHQKVPLANLQAIDGADSNVTVKMMFFSKPISDLKITEDKVTVPLKEQSPDDTVLLDKLATWKQSIQIVDNTEFSASDSSSLSPF